MIFLTKAKKTWDAPRLEKYIRFPRRYSTYNQASRLYSMDYYQFVRFAKEANACWKVRKKVIVDLEKFESYLEKFRDGGN